MRIRLLDIGDKDGGVFAFTTERGAAARFEPYGAFNCCDYVGDDEEHVASCRSDLCRELGIADGSLVTARQVHGDEVAVVGSGMVAMDCEQRAERLVGVDALVTNVPGIVIGVFTADCVPVLLADLDAGVVAAVHSGWKGTVKGIAARAIDRMSELGASPSAVRAFIGPAICMSCFEVGDEVSDEFLRYGFPMAELMRRNHRTGKVHIDLVRANAWLLEQSGVLSGHIRRSGLCTKCEPERFFSARVLGAASGRILTGIGIR